MDSISSGQQSVGSAPFTVSARSSAAVDTAFPKETKGTDSSRPPVGSGEGKAKATYFSHQTAVFAARIAADLFSIGAAILAAGGLAWTIDTMFLHVGYNAFSADDLQRRAIVWLFLAGALSIWFGAVGTYTSRRPMQEDIKQMMAALSVVLVVDGFIEFASKEHFSRLWIFLVWPMAALAIPLGRSLIRRALNTLGIWRTGAAVLGSGGHYIAIEQSLMSDFYVGYYVAYHSDLVADLALPISQIAAKLKSDMRLRGAQTVILVPNDDEIGNLARIIDALNFNLTPYVLIPPINRLPFAGLTIQSIVSSDAIMMTSRNGLLSPARRATKRIFDVLVSSCLLVFLAPLFLILSFLVSISGGAPIFGHERIGKGGKSFYCLKFRSMARNSDKILKDLLASDPEIARQWQKNFKLKNDPRITPLGRFLRKSSLDELPQLINVIRGEMSLVGPRPVIAQELENYYGEDAFYYRLVRPGVTGLWQVSGRSQTSYERRVFLDSWYVRNWSLWTDLVLLVNTIPSAIKGDGAQ